MKIRVDRDLPIGASPLRSNGAGRTGASTLPRSKLAVQEAPLLSDI